ncbi:MAG: efflux RND transporter permease subunit [Deltaproteobacteria bacterium]|nr:MAG: efflux RND transporter permease subunit [Deltaproteobacteria bacterium]UCF47064.1 MAG: efflux RND transporter permease subunit [Myxococcales bacterium]
MSLTEFALKRRTVTGTLIVVLLFAGIAAYQNAPRQMDPGFIIRTAMVTTYFPGASPERVEQLITDPIEKAVQEIPELDWVDSESRTGVSVIYVNIREEFTQMRPIWDDLRRKVDDVTPSLPDGITGPIVNDEFGDVYPIMFSMTGDGFSYMELKDIADDLRDELLRFKSVAKVDIMGAQEERLFVEYDNAVLSNLGMTPQFLKDSLQQRNIIQPGGEIDVEAESIALEPSGNFSSVEELRRTVIRVPNTDELVYLEDIVDIYRGYVDPPEGLVRIDGQPGLTLAISMAEGGNLIRLGEELEGFFQYILEQYPHGVDFYRTYFQPDLVERKVDDFVDSVVQAVVIVLVVMLLTLGLRTGLVVATLVPTTMIITVAAMNIFDIQLDQMSLAALIIALGLLVDNAIVVSESIMVRMAEGQKGFDAAIGATSELRVPLLIASLTTAAAFLPIRLAESAVGEYTGVLFSVVAITLLISWVLALTMIPTLCVRFLKPKPVEEPFDSRFFRLYRTIILSVLRRPVLSIAVAIVGFFGGIQLYGLVPQLFFPQQAINFFVAELTFPPGTSIRTTEAMIKDMEAYIQSDLAAKEGKDGVTHWASFISTTPPRFTLTYNPDAPKPRYSETMVHTTTAKVVPEVMAKLEHYVTERHPDVRPHIRPLGNGPPVRKPIEVRISGKEVDKVFEIADDVKQWLNARADTRNVGDDWGPKVKKLFVEVSEEQARRAGITNEDVATSLQTFLSGYETTRYREDDKTIPVVLRSVAEGRRDIDRLGTLSVFAQDGSSVPLTQVATGELEWESSEIMRRDLSPTVTVDSDTVEGVTAFDIIAELQPWLDEQEKSWGIGYRYEFGGEAEGSGKANASIADKLPIAGMVIIILLVWQFDSLRKPTIVLATILFALVGVAIGLLIVDRVGLPGGYFGFMTLLGIVSLAGIVINNGIVLIDRIDIEKNENGLDPPHAVIQAAQQRFRPIMLTTATTIASLIPLYVGGEEMFQPMAIAIMFGLAFSTLLTLGFVPLMYSLFFRVSFKDFVYPN